MIASSLLVFALLGQPPMKLDLLRGIPSDQFEAARKIIALGGNVWPVELPAPPAANLVNFNGKSFTDQELPLLWPFVNQPLHGIGFVNTSVSETAVKEALERFPNIKSLTVSQMPIGDSAFVELNKLSGLIHIWLSDTRITSTTLEQLRNQRALIELNISDTAVDDRGMEYLEGLSKLEMLLVVRTKITSVGLRSIGKLKRLERMALYETQIDDEGLRHLTDLQKLIFLGLKDTRVTNAGMAHVAKLSGLKQLDLRDTKVDATGLALLQNMPSLREVQWDGDKNPTPETKLFNARFHLYLPGNSDRWHEQRKQFERGELIIE